MSVVIADHQWLQLDLGPPTLVTGIVTKGRGDKKNWVTSYSLSYSNDTKIWFYYKDANHLEAKVSPNNGSLSSGSGSGNYHVSRGATLSKISDPCSVSKHSNCLATSCVM